MKAQEALSEAIKATMAGLTYQRASEITELAASRLNLIANGKVEVRLTDLADLLPRLQRLDRQKFDSSFWFDRFVEDERTRLTLDPGGGSPYVSEIETAVSEVEMEIPMVLDVAVAGALTMGVSAHFNALQQSINVAPRLQVAMRSSKNVTTVKAQNIVLLSDIVSERGLKRLVEGLNAQADFSLSEADLIAAGARQIESMLSDTPRVFTRPALLGGAPRSLILEPQTNARAVEGQMELSSLPETEKYLKQLCGHGGNSIDAACIVSIDPDTRNGEVLVSTPIEFTVASRRPKKQPDWANLVANVTAQWSTLGDPAMLNQPVSIRDRVLFGVALRHIHSKPDRHGLVHVFVYVNYEMSTADKTVINARQFHRSASLYFGKDMGHDYRATGES